MKMSTKGRYGLRAMLALAITTGQSHVSLSYIADTQQISSNYLEQVFSTLRKAGLVKSVKGAQGGYVLADIPAHITVGSILRALEGNLSITGENEDVSGDNTVEHCLRLNVWDTINTSINTVVDSITLEDLIMEYKKLDSNLSLMYYI